MKTNYGKFLETPGSYQLDKIPEAGNFEFILKNKCFFVKVDQFGPASITIDPPGGMTVLQRKEREQFSPWKYYFNDGKTVVNNFDIYSAKKMLITYSPNKITYDLTFKTIKAVTEITISELDREAIMSVKLINLKANPTKVSVLGVGMLDPIDTTMAIWDKMSWYSTTEVDGVDNPLFLTKHFSVNGAKEDRRVIGLLFEGKAISVQNSAEYLRSFTKGFTSLPKMISNGDTPVVACYEQGCGAMFEVNLDKEVELSSILRVEPENIDKSMLLKNLDKETRLESLARTQKVYEDLISRRTVKTNDKNFDSFVNYFIPLELGWVADLDRGWPTGMRGARDCANDFLGYFAYDAKKCRDVIKRLFDNERYDDGWFPRQIPFGDIKKYDLRPFADSGAFIIELVYEYLAYTDDYSLLEETFDYLNEQATGNGLQHLIRAVSYYTLEENIGEHGLIKLHGGDWLDCLNRVGLEGRGESLMVTCQAILAIKEVSEVLERYGDKYQETIDALRKFSKKLTKAAKDACYMKDEGYYRSLFSDDGNWYFSEKDKDGNKRVYVPTNAYTIIAGVDPSKDKKVIKTINKYNESKIGFKIFTVPFGNPPFEGIGKMGTGDFQPYMFENGAVYNHGANLFYSRALAKVGDYKTLYRAVNYALPYNQKFHPEFTSYLPSYAMTNCYNLTPAFNGRGGLSFLTGSIAMVERTVYSWMFGLDYHIENLTLSPCIPVQYKDAVVTDHFVGNEIKVIYHGYGNKIVSCVVNGTNFEPVNGKVVISKKLLNKDTVIEVTLENK